MDGVSTSNTAILSADVPSKSRQSKMVTDIIISQSNCTDDESASELV